MDFAAYRDMMNRRLIHDVVKPTRMRLTGLILAALTAAVGLGGCQQQHVQPSDQADWSMNAEPVESQRDRMEVIWLTPGGDAMSADDARYPQRTGPGAGSGARLHEPGMPQDGIRSPGSLQGDSWDGRSYDANTLEGDADDVESVQPERFESDRVEPERRSPARRRGISPGLGPAPPADFDAKDLRPMFHRRTLAMDAAQLRLAKARAGMSDMSRRGGELAWYAYRNDARRTVDAGLKRRIIDTAELRTWDSLHVHGNHSHYHFNRTVHRRRVTQTVR